MGWHRGGATPRRFGVCSFITGGRYLLRQADGSTPLVEHVQNVSLAKVNAHGPALGPFAVVPLEVAIDAAARDLDRYAVGRPSRDHVEGGSDDPDQVAVV